MKVGVCRAIIRLEPKHGRRKDDFNRDRIILLIDRRLLPARPPSQHPTPSLKFSQ